MPWLLLSGRTRCLDLLQRSEQLLEVKGFEHHPHPESLELGGHLGIFDGLHRCRAEHEGNPTYLPIEAGQMEELLAFFLAPFEEQILEDDVRGDGLDLVEVQELQ